MSKLDMTPIGLGIEAATLPRDFRKAHRPRWMEIDGIRFALMLALVLMFAALACLIGYELLSARTKIAKIEADLGDATEELMLSRSAQEFQRRCTPAITQMKQIGWDRGVLTCITYEQRRGKWVKVGTTRVATIEAILGFPLPQAVKGSRDPDDR